jgi:putative ABC transport system permease protein
VNLFESLRVALRALASNKLRTALTMLGIIIGVAVVIVVVAIGQGATQRVTTAISSLGTNLLTIRPGATRMRITTATAKGLPAQTNRLTLEDAKLVARNFPQTIAGVAPQVRGNVQIRLAGRDSTTSLTGTTIDYPYVTNTTVAHGRFFTNQEVDGRLRVCVAGQTVAERLTGDAAADLTGQTLSINRQNFTIVGMLASKGSATFGPSPDDVVLVPITTAMSRVLNQHYLSFMTIRCVNEGVMPLAEEQIASFLRSRHHLRPPFPDNDDFMIQSQTELLERSQTVTGTMTSLLSAIAVISLVVGGIGIMNIMLVSVRERTREIGIRKAVGGTPRDILLQFLIESAIIALVGGLIGIGMGIGGAIGLSKLGGWNTVVSPGSVVVALIVSAGVGLFFGIYPAAKAAALHPIEALRYE